VKIAIALMLVAAVLGVVWVAAPEYLPLGMQASATVESGTGSAGGVAVPAKSDESPAGEVGLAQGVRARALVGADQYDRAVAADESRRASATGAVEQSAQGPSLTDARPKLSAGGAKPLQILGCLIAPDQTAEIGSPVVGVVSSIKVERGDRVTRGQVLAELRAEVERASVEVAQVRTQAEADLRAAKSNVEFLRQKQARAEELVAKNFISQQALEQALADTRLAEEKLAQAREQKLIWKRELELANAQLQMRYIRAPFDGVVVDRYVSVGERIDERPLFRIVKTDPLRVEMVAPAALFGSVSAGALASVTPDLPNAPAFTAQVVLVDTLIDGASNTFRVRASLANPDGALPSGLRCRAELSAQPASAAAPPPTAINGGGTATALRVNPQTPSN